MSHVRTAPKGAGLIKAGWLAPGGLLLLGLLPVVAGAFRLSQLSGVSDAMPVNPRFTPMPLPVVLHIVSATVFAILGHSSSQPVSDAAGRRGTGWRGASWLLADSWWA